MCIPQGLCESLPIANRSWHFCFYLNLSRQECKKTKLARVLPFLYPFLRANSSCTKNQFGESGKTRNLLKMVSSRKTGKDDLRGGDEQPSFGEGCEFDFSKMLAWLKKLARNPYASIGRKPQAHELRHQTLTLRKLLSLDGAGCPRRKRARSKSSPPFGLSSERPSHPKQIIKRSSPRFSSSIRSSVDTTDSEDGAKPSSEDDAKLFDNSPKKQRQEGKFLRSMETQTRPVVPIGPSFQAEVPAWTGSYNPGSGYNDDDSENLKWLGTRVWPLEGKNLDMNNDDKIGKGRPDSCSCRTPGSLRCIDRHLFKARLRLESSLGPAFLIWKFDEMGDVVLGSWTLKERKKFQSLWTKYTMPMEKGFWEAAMKAFPSKSRKDLVSYYFNIVFPKRIREMTTVSPGDKDGFDDD